MLLGHAARIVGGFSAAFIVYVIAGSLVGLAVTLAYEGVCPVGFFGALGAGCEGALIRTIFFAIADLPSGLMIHPLALAINRAGPYVGVTDVGMMIGRSLQIQGAFVVVGLTLIGLGTWARVAPRFALMLALILLGEVAVCYWLFTSAA